MTRELKKLKQLRANLKANLTRFGSYLQNLHSDDDLVTLQLRLKNTEPILQEFTNLQLDIDSYSDSDEISELELSEFEENYYNFIGKAQQLINQKQQDNQNRNSATLTENSVTSVKAKLPTINLPTFNGRYETWLEFYDRFNSLIHENREINDVEKLHYLRSCLTGEALHVINSLKTTSNNYTIAWRLLKDRFDNHWLIIQTHIKAICELPSASKDTRVTLRQLVNSTQGHVLALQSLGEKVEFWDSWLIYEITRKLDKLTYREWTLELTDTKPTYTQLIAFIQKRFLSIHLDETSTIHNKIQGRDSTFSKGRNQANRVQQIYVQSQPGNANNTGTRYKLTCPMCKLEHRIQSCDRYLMLSTTERANFIKKASLCYNCLRSNHMLKDCRASHCRLCPQRHHTTLHPIETDSNPQLRTDTDASTSANCISLQTCIDTEVLLSTAIVYIEDQEGRRHNCRLLLDSGSQSNFITERLVSKLHLNKTSISIPVSGLNQLRSRINHKVETTINSTSNAFKTRLSFLVVNNITEALPSRQIARHRLDIPKNIHLADPEFHKPANIEALLGAEIFYQLLCIGQIKLSSSHAILQKTHLGWIISGRVGGLQTNTFRTSCLVAATNTPSMENLQEEISKFWELEEPTNKQYLSSGEAVCESHFQQTVRRNNVGRFIVQLPFNEKKLQLGESYSMALKRFYSLERKFQGNPELRIQYTQFLNEYLELGHMRLTTTPSTQGYYLPHHPIIKQTSLTTKLRVVFDGSAKTTTGITLNDTLRVGPTIQEDIFSIIMRFRTHLIALTADIEKMYRQVKLHSEDTNYHKILWRESPDQIIREYSLQTVTYGTSSAPFLAVRCLHRLADEESSKYPIAARILKQDFYVDDLITGTNTLKEAIHLRDELMQLLHSGGFNLRQWASNIPSLIQSLPQGASKINLQVDADHTLKTLGVHWNTVHDDIVYTVTLDHHNQRITKRTILSDIAKLFDPLGLLGPVIVKAKIIMQQLWQIQANWDESVPSYLQTSWLEFKNDLLKLNNITIPRRIIEQYTRNIQLHGFCDASEKAYGACIYIRSKINERYLTRLLCAKSRVAPLKTISLPRLELCAALLLSTLYNVTVKALKMNIARTFFWSDSTIVLTWINTPPNTLKTFVANRVSEIQQIIKAIDWRHVASLENPADTISRGQSPTEFLTNDIWFNGPAWIQHDEETWPSTITKLEHIPEQKAAICLKSTLEPLDIISNSSSLTRLKRTIAYCLRFINKAKRKTSATGPLTTIELQESLNCLIQIVQRDAFHDELKNLRTSKDVVTKTNLAIFQPFIDHNQVLRVGGRIKYADVTPDQRHPILLPKNHNLTKLILQHIHIEQGHAGAQATLNAVQQHFWPIDGRNLTRRIIYSCVTCFKSRPRMAKYVMGNLPKDRITQARPFLKAGVDYCGPFYIKEKRHRNRNKIKTYVAVFTCFTTRAVHLELVSDLTTEAFLATLRRFFARRGKSQIIYSDNATNFVGANRNLQDLHKFFKTNSNNEIITNQLANQNIAWHFIPPRSPHFGGLWEAAVKSFKYHMLRIVGNSLLTYEQLYTFITEIEAILNSRPITPISSDPNDLLALTPGHFLIGESMTSIPEHDFTDTQSNRLSAWQHTQKMKQHFWTRWHKEYLNELNLRYKWQSGSTHTITPGTMVIIKQDNLQPMHWPLGRVTDTHPGQDGVVRVVSVQTSSGTYKRCVKNLAPLPIEDSE